MSVLAISLVEILKTEWLGLIASAVVIVSFLASEQIKIRIINMVGSVIFVVYGFILPSYSTAFMNLVMIVVHIVYIVKYFKVRSKEKVLEKNGESETEQSFNHESE